MLGDTLRYYRLKQQLTQEQVALKINQTPQSINNYEHNIRQPELNLLIALSKVLGFAVVVKDGQLFIRNLEEAPLMDFKEEFVMKLKDACEGWENEGPNSLLVKLHSYNDPYFNKFIRTKSINFLAFEGLIDYLSNASKSEWCDELEVEIERYVMESDCLNRFQICITDVEENEHTFLVEFEYQTPDLYRSFKGKLLEEAFVYCRENPLSNSIDFIEFATECYWFEAYQHEELGEMTIKISNICSVE